MNTKSRFQEIFTEDFMNERLSQLPLEEGYDGYIELLKRLGK